MRRLPLIAALLLAALPCAHAAAFRVRGVLEGFYGRPWTWEERRAMVRWMAARGFNLLVIAPKDEPLQRAEWRRPLPPAYVKELARLAAEARQAGVVLGWTLSPGLDLKAGDPVEVRVAAAKLKAVRAAGATALALAFDDTEADPAQVDFANAVREALGGSPSLTFVPAQYWSRAAPSPYLDAVAARLHPSFMIGFTGPGILNRRIDAPQARRFKEYIRHKLVVGDNYPVQDRVAECGRLFLGPLEGRDPELAAVTDAYLANASPLAQASKLPLATVAEFLRDPARYDPERALQRAAALAARPQARAALAAFIRLNRSSWVHPREAQRPAQGLARLQEALGGRLAPGLERELAPWVDKAVLLARALEGEREAAAAAQSRCAIVGDFILEKALRNDHCAGLRGQLAAHVRGEAVPQLSACLHSLEKARGGLLVPAADALGLAAGRARRALEGRPPRAAFDRLYRWHVRARFLPLLAAKAFLDDCLARGWRLPRLYAALERWEVRGLPDEARPWLWRVQDYGRAGARVAQGLHLAAHERERLRSGNGLELALELKQALDAFVRWSRLPEPRPKELDLELPADGNFL